MELGVERSPRELDTVVVRRLAARAVDSIRRWSRWYMNYCCRDDYGAMATDTSAWAGVHYFASREPEEKGPLTWPEGNGWITKRLLRALGRFRAHGPDGAAHRARRGTRYVVPRRSVRYVAEAVIFAAPTFLAQYLIEGFGPSPRFEYSPWLTANLTLDRPPRGAGPLDRAWDNVVAHSPTLGYVDATHHDFAPPGGSHGVDLLLGAGGRIATCESRSCCCRKIGAIGARRSCTIWSVCIPMCGRAYRVSTSCAWGMPWRGRWWGRSSTPDAGSWRVGGAGCGSRIQT